MSLKKQFLKTKPAYSISFSKPKSFVDIAKSVHLLDDFNNWNVNDNLFKKSSEGKNTSKLDPETGKEQKFLHLLNGAYWLNEVKTDKGVSSTTGYADNTVTINKLGKRKNLKLYIKNMVSNRCKMLVKAELEKLGVHYIMVTLGEVEIMEELTDEQRENFKAALLEWGLELMIDKKTILIERIKNVIIEMIHYAEELPKIKFSNYISEKLKYDYTYLANLFSEETGNTIEHYIISHRVERVKELLLYDELNLTEISYKLNFCSVAHLSNQFKKATGLTPTFFRQLKNKKRNLLENV